MKRKTLSFLLRALLALALLLPTVHAQQPERRASIPRDPALERALDEAGYAELTVLVDGWKETLTGFARIKLDELTGRTSLPGVGAEYAVLSMMYEPQKWYDAAILPVEHPKVAEILGAQGKWVSPRFVAENPGVDQLRALYESVRDREIKLRKLNGELNAAEQLRRLPDRAKALDSLVASGGVTRERLLELADNAPARDLAEGQRRLLRRELAVDRPAGEAALRLADRVQLFGRLYGQFRIVPDNESTTGAWLSPADLGIASPDDPMVAAAARLNDALALAFEKDDPASLAPGLREFLAVASTHPAYPDDVRNSVKNTYYSLSPFRNSAWIYLLAALAYFGAFSLASTRWRGAATGILVAGFAVHTAAVVFRIYLTGRMPVSNMYESITFTSWTAMLIAVAVELRRRSGIVGLGAAVIGFLALTASSLMPLHETRLHPLRAVLSSYWLNIHVTVMLLSYGAFALAAFLGAAYFIRGIRRAPEGALSADQIEELGYRLIQLGWPLLTLGIVLGAIWADVAWGRFWGWDPKETWAFVTWLTYTIYLHCRMVAGWKGGISATMLIVGFLMVLMTWFGVSYLPYFSGGLHSYASPT